eukprot:3702036-Prorocentrum_lima.AAC.1
MHPRRRTDSDKFLPSTMLTRQQAPLLEDATGARRGGGRWVRVGLVSYPGAAAARFPPPVW